MADEPLVAVFDSNFEIKPGDSLKVSNSTGFLLVFIFCFLCLTFSNFLDLYLSQMNLCFSSFSLKIYLGLYVSFNATD